MGALPVPIRRILVDCSRRRAAAKRGGGWEQVALLDDVLAESARSLDMLELDRVLELLNEQAPCRAWVVELRFFGGLEFKEVAEVLRISLSTVERDWRFACAWLYAL